MHRNTIVVVGAFLSVGCAEVSRSPTTDDLTSSYIREYEREYADYRVTSDRLPLPNLKKVAELRSQPLWKNSTLELTLHLGVRTRNGAGRFRTSSRYELRDKSGALLGIAESVLAREDFNESELSPSVQIAFDPVSRNLLVIEEHSWSVERTFILSADGQGQEARYVRVPARRSLEPFNSYQVVALADGKLYIKQDEVLFALPLDALPSEAGIDYSIGATQPTKNAQQVRDGDAEEAV